MMLNEKQKQSGGMSDGRIVDCLSSGEALVQRVNQKAGMAVLPEFSMWPTLAATVVLGAIIVWCGVGTCQALGDECWRLEQEERQSTAAREELIDMASRPARTFRKTSKAFPFVPHGK